MRDRLGDLNLVTADVGSLPAEDDFEGDRNNVNRAITDKVEVGLDYPTYPQLVGTTTSPMNMGLQFLRPLSNNNPSLQIRGEEINLVGDTILEPDYAIGIERAEYFTSFIQKNDLGKKLKGTRACVTGPFTLASYIGTKNLMTCGASKPQIVATLGSILGKSCRRLSELGFNIISIDEPFLSVILGASRLLYSYNQDFVISTLNTLIAQISNVSSIHVCGRVTPLVRSTLLATNVNIIDHEFSQTPKNNEAYTEHDLDQSDKLLAYGCISSVDLRVETVEDIARVVRNAQKLFGQRIIVKPDCGFGGLKGIGGAYKSTFDKLRNMVCAAREVRIQAS